MEVQVWLQCNMTILLPVQLTVNMCGLRTALEHIKTCAMQTKVEAAHSLKGWPRGAQTTSTATPTAYTAGTFATAYGDGHVGPNYKYCNTPLPILQVLT